MPPQGWRWDWWVEVEFGFDVANRGALQALHRNISSRITPVAQLQRRSRIWGACIIADRW